MRRYIFYIFIFTICTQGVAAQNYHALHGSSYAGSLAPSQNPAGIVHVPYKWDVTVFGLQLKQSTNAFTIQPLSYFSLLSPPDSVIATGNNGVRKHFFAANQDLHLFNARISLNPRTAIAFGAKLRSYVFAEGEQAHWQDTIFSLADFLRINMQQQPLAANVKGTAWGELTGTIGHTILNDGDRLLNAGITLKLTRAIAGLDARLSGVTFNQVSAATPADKEYFNLTDAQFSYGYSANFDGIDSNRSTMNNIKSFLKNTTTSISADIGIEYIFLADEDKDLFGGYAYETKLGISLMDIGTNKYLYSSRSRVASGFRPAVTDTLVESSLSGANNVDAFNDSLASIASNISSQQGNFSINQPTRLLINVDQHIKDNFFVNAEISLPVGSLFSNGESSIRDLNYAALTPRWELRSVGVYMPVLYNNKKQLWVGAALRLGPLLMGTHNLASVFAKDKIQSGGAYLAFTIRPGRKADRQQYLPGRKVGSNEQKGARCPVW